MMTYVKAFGMFLAFYVVTKVVIAPQVNSLNLPVIGKSL